MTSTDFEKNTLRSGDLVDRSDDEMPEGLPPPDPPEKVAEAILETVETGKAEQILIPKRPGR
jgi:hypothetical protein